MSRWYLRITADSGGRSHPHEQPMSICPLCLAQDRDPHWRREWALATSCRCPKHRMLLVDRCLHCGVRLAISLHRRRALTACEACGESQLAIASREAFVASNPQWSEGHSQPGATTPPFGLAYEHLYWDGVWWLLGHFCTKAAGVTPLAYAEMRSAAPRSQPDPTSPFTKGFFVDRGPRERERLLAIIRWLLEDWPERAVRLLRAGRLSRSSFSVRAGDIGTRMPFWIEDVVDAHLNLRPYRPCREEVLEAAAHLERTRHVRPSRKQLKDLLGITESREVSEVVPVSADRLTPTIALKLLQAMDAMIAMAPRARAHRDSVVRDCVLIAVCLAGSLQLGQAVQLTRADVHHLLARQRRSARKWRRALYSYVLEWQKEMCTGLLAQDADRDGLQQMFMTRFGRAYLGHSVPGRTVQLLESIGFGSPSRGIGVARDIDDE